MPILETCRGAGLFVVLGSVSRSLFKNQKQIICRKIYCRIYFISK
jgi:hypothetical protein